MQRKLTKFGQKFVSYGSYHHDPVNQWIHIVCVPIIVLTLFAMISYIPIRYELNGWSVGLEFPALLLTAIFYLKIDSAFGVGMSVLFVVLTYAWKTLFSELSKEQSFFSWIVVVHVVSWILQFIGHGVFQKRKPALLDSLPQVLSAPLFVLVEVAMKLGIKPKQSDYWMELIEKRVAQFREKNKVK